MDIVLLNHELMEIRLMSDNGMTYNVAHRIAEARWNYARFVQELDISDKQRGQ